MSAIQTILNCSKRTITRELLHLIVRRVIARPTDTSRKRLLLTLSLLSYFLTTGTACGGVWISPSTFTVRSSDGKYLARLDPARGPRKRESPIVTVFPSDDPKEIWKTQLSNRVSPTTAMLSDDGRYIVTLDNWYKSGHGDDLLAFYDRNGQVAKYSLEGLLGDKAEILKGGSFGFPIAYTTSGIAWRVHNLMFFDKNNDTPTFGIWLDWAGQWFVWELANGEPVNLSADIRNRWNNKGLQWAREHLQLPPVRNKPSTKVMLEWKEEAQAWSRRKSARYHSKITACRYLAYLKDPNNRKLLEETLASTERNQNGEMELRINADRALAIHDGAAKNFLTQEDFRRNNERLYMLGSIHLTIRLPRESAKEGQVYVSIFPSTVTADDWRTAAPVHRIGKSLNSSLAKTEDRSLELSLRAVKPGSYWVKTVWDRIPPFRHDLYGYEGMRDWKDTEAAAPPAEGGDFENEGGDVFEVTAGETIHVTLDCVKPGRGD